MSYEGERLDNGVLARVHEGGDGWAEAHRALGANFYMHDVDTTFGFQVFGMNTGDRLFLETEPDDYSNRGNLIRNFGLVALFDRKSSIESAEHDGNVLCMAFYLWQCRVFATQQKQPPKFFVVAGTRSHPPWTMQEYDIETGERAGDAAVLGSIDGTEIRSVWDQLGLLKLRQELREWI